MAARFRPSDSLLAAKSSVAPHVADDRGAGEYLVAVGVVAVAVGV